MAILAHKGKLSTAQQVTFSGAEISTGIINVGALEDIPEETWLQIDNVLDAVGSGACTIDLELGDAVGLDGTNVKVLTLVIAAETDHRIALGGAHILGCTLPREVRELAEQLGYDYLGLRYTLTSSLDLTFNAAISPSRPRTRDKSQTVVSPVGVPTAPTALT